MPSILDPSPLGILRSFISLGSLQKEARVLGIESLSLEKIVSFLYFHVYQQKIATSVIESLLTRFEEFSRLNQFMNQLTKKDIGEFSALIVSGDANQILLDTSQNVRQWAMDSSTHLQRGHKGSTSIFLLMRLDLVGMAL